jgi:alpha-N-arabinofuranosidase
MANLAQTVNVLQAIILTEGRKMLLTPTYHIFDLYKVHQDAKYLPLKTTTPDYTVDNQRLPAVNVSASQDSTGAIHISLVNIDPNKNIPVTISVNGGAWKTVTGQMLTSPKLTDLNSFDKMNTVQIAKFTGARRQENNLAVDLPSKSVVVLKLQ